MKKTAWVSVAVLILIQQGISRAPDAGAVTWSVKDSGGNVVCQGSGTPVANLPATCGAGPDLEFQASGGTARIEAIDTGDNDILQLLNTKIVARKNLTDYVLTFDHTFAPGPTKIDYSPIYYRTRMFGSSISCCSPANKITVTSTVEHPVGTMLLPAGPLSAPPPQVNFDYWHSPSTNSDMDLNRKIIVNVKFSLENTKNVNFPANRFVRVSAQPQPDDPPDAAGGKLDSALAETLKGLEEGSKVCLGLSLPDGGCAGINITK